MKYVVDTSAIIEAPQIIDKYNCIITSLTLRELEQHKKRFDELGYKARQAVRYIDDNKGKVEFDLKDYHFTLTDDFDSNYTDNKILQCCYDNGYGLITNDLLLKLKANGFGIKVLEIKDDEDDYSGYLELQLSDEEIAYFYENLGTNIYNLLVNQYLIIKNKYGEIIETVRWDGEMYRYAHQKGFTTQMFGKFKPFDAYQVCALDSLMNNQMTMIKGKAGSGKSLLTLNYAWSMIERGKYDKLIIFSNPVKVKNASALGYYKGTRTEKLLDSQIGIMLGSKFGDEMQVQMLINNNKLALYPFSDIRGFDTSGQKSIVWFTESQNLDIELMKLGLQRCSDDCKIIIDGDPKTQVDLNAYEGSRNGMKRVSKIFRGKDFYGEVELKNIFRSKVAKVADLM